MYKWICALLFPHPLLPTVSSSEHPEPHQPQLLLGAGAERQLPGPLHEDGDRDPAGGQCHHHPAAQWETGRTEAALLNNMVAYITNIITGWSWRDSVALVQYLVYTQACCVCSKANSCRMWLPFACLCGQGRLAAERSTYIQLACVCRKWRGWFVCDRVFKNTTFGTSEQQQTCDPTPPIPPTLWHPTCQTNLWLPMVTSFLMEYIHMLHTSALDSNTSRFALV